MGTVKKVQQVIQKGISDDLVDYALKANIFDVGDSVKDAASKKVIQGLNKNNLKTFDDVNVFQTAKYEKEANLLSKSLENMESKAPSSSIVDKATRQANINVEARSRTNQQNTLNSNAEAAQSYYSHVENANVKKSATRQETKDYEALWENDLGGQIDKKVFDNGRPDSQSKLDKYVRQREVDNQSKPFWKKLNGKDSQDVITKGYESTIKNGNKHTEVTDAQYKDALKSYIDNGGSNPGTRKEYTATRKAQINNGGRANAMDASEDLENADKIKKSGLLNMMWNHKGATAAVGIGAAWGVSELTDDGGL